MAAEITIYTDGAARGNPGPGGYGVVLMSGIHRKELSEFMTWDSMLLHLQAQPLLDEFVAYADGKGLKRRYNSIMKSRKLIERNIYANVIYDILGMLEHVKYINTFDPTVLKAVEVLEQGKAFPVAPEE